MKKTTMNAIVAFIDAMDAQGSATQEVMDARAEIIAELTKGEAQKVKNAEAYDALHDVIVGNLSNTPVTCGELWDAIKDDVPEGTTKGKVQYALTHLWQDEIVKIEGKPNSYRKA